MEKARDKGAWNEMEKICRRSLKDGYSNEYLMRSLSFCLLKKNKFRESFKVAKENKEKNNQNRHHICSQQKTFLSKKFSSAMSSILHNQKL